MREALLDPLHHIYGVSDKGSPWRLPICCSALIPLESDG